MKEMVGGCCVCSDERGWDENPLVYCDGQGCNVAVHQACYGIVKVPSGPWFCRKCESQERTARVHCELCPSRDGALKRTDNNGWAHVVCALYIPEVRFGNVTTMEPIQTSLIPPDRYGKTCYICEESNREPKSISGACMNCNKAGCKQSFHVTCAQLLGLLCEEAGNLMDNVKYCGYCRLHYSKLRKTSNLKIIPPYKPIGSNLSSESPASSPEKNQVSQSSMSIATGEGQMSASSNSNNGGKKPLGTGSGLSGNANGKPSIGSSLHSNQQSLMPRVQLQPNLFTSNKFAATLEKSEESMGKVDKAKLKLLGSSSSKSEDDHNSNNKGAANETGMISKSESFGKAFSSGSSSTFSIRNKDFSNVSVTDVVAATLDKPIGSSSSIMASSSASKVHNDDSNSSAKNSNPTTGSSSSTNSRPPPPDIKPHVTLTPIPPILPTANDDHSRRDSRGSKSPAHHFPSSSFGPSSSSKIHCQVSPDISRDGKKDKADEFEKSSSPLKRPRNFGVDCFDSDTDSASETWRERHEEEDLEAVKHSQHVSREERYTLPGQEQDRQNQAQAKNMEMWLREQERQRPGEKSPSVSLERLRFETERPSEKLFDAELSTKRGPGRPIKRNSANSRDEDLRDRKMPAKARGRRGGGGSSNGSFTPRRDTSNGGTPPALDENYDDSRDSGSTRGGRHSGPARKPNPAASASSSTSGSAKKPNYDEIPTPTLSQLKAQMNSNSGDKSSPALAPQMFGNVLNTNSSMANRLVDTLSQEMEAAGVSESTSAQTKVVQIPLPGKNSTSSAAANGGSTSRGGNTTAPPQTLEELLERQWEQGSQFLMEQAEHLDIAQLLSCLNQLKQDNRALEDHVASLIQRKEHLSAIHARLQIPLSLSSTAIGASFGNPNGQGTPQTNALPGSNKGFSGRGPSPEQKLQQQIQQEALMHQGRIPTHPFPGTETGQMHGPRRELPHSGGVGSGQGLVYGYSSSGLPVPVVTSHPSNHHPSAGRE